MRDHAQRVLSNRTRGADDCKTFHALKNQYNTGAAKKRLSRRSSMPPCPGRIEEESFTPALRFKTDSARSPNCPTAAVTAEIMINFGHGSPNNKTPEAVPAATLARRPAAPPSIVFF